MGRRVVASGRKILPRGVDGRRVEARRYRKLLQSFLDEAGDAANSTANVALVRRGAALCVRAEMMEREFVQGGEFDVGAFVTMTNTILRLFERLGIAEGRTPQKEGAVSKADDDLETYLAVREASGGRK